MENELLESVIGYDALYESMEKCRRGVAWKDSVAHFYLNAPVEVLKLEKELKSGTYRPRQQKKVRITHPKPRDAVAIAFRDRVYQRSLNDVVIYSEMAKHLIPDNFACQKGKGTDAARDRLDEFLHSYYRHCGAEGWVLQTDIEHYYPSMAHWVVEDCFRRYLPEEIYARAAEVLHAQYDGEVGYNPGSQMVQIAGISILNPLDHYIKEQLCVKYYLRYMDDSVHIHNSRGFLDSCLARESEFVGRMNFKFHPKKTRIYPLSNGIKILGFTHKLTDTGKVIRLIDSDNVKAERKKLFRMAQRVKRGEMPKEHADKCYESWKAHAAHGNTYKVVRRMDEYYKSLWR